MSKNEQSLPFSDDYCQIEYKGDYVDFIQKIQKIEYSCVLNKDLMNEEYKSISIDDIESGISNGKYKITVDNTVFECFMNFNSNDDRLFVFLSGAAVNNNIFQRWSWNPFGNTVAIADPMSTSFGMSLGWYYGTKDTDYRSLVSKIIKEIANLKNIPIENITIYGSSGGGTSAIYVTSYLKGCTCLSINPQIDIHSLERSYKRIESIMALSIDAPDLKNRNDVHNAISSDTESKYILLVNCLSKEDMDGIYPLSLDLKMPIHYGRNNKKNVCIWIYKAKPLVASSGDWATHNSQDYLALFQLFDYLLRNNLFFNKNNADLFLMLTKIWQERFDNVNELLKYKTIMSANDDPKAQYRLAKMYLTGDHVNQDEKQYLELLKKSANAGVYVAKEELKQYNNVQKNNSIQSQTAFKEGMRYRENGSSKISIDEAIHYMEIAYKLKHPWSKNELLNLLWIKSTPESLQEYVEICSSSLLMGEYDSELYLARAYRDGKGVEKDLEKAKQLLRHAIEHEVTWAKCELFDILWFDDGPSSKKEMIKLAEDGANNGDLYLTGRLARAYWKGNGVAKDLVKAKELMSYASSSNDIPWASKELDAIATDLKGVNNEQR